MNASKKKLSGNQETEKRFCEFLLSLLILFCGIFHAATSIPMSAFRGEDLLGNQEERKPRKVLLLSCFPAFLLSCFPAFIINSFLRNFSRRHFHPDVRLEGKIY
jgi:hypothetical protein